MKDVHCEEIEALLDFMYRGVVHIQKTALSSLLKTAEGLQIRGLGLFAQETVQQIDPSMGPTGPAVNGGGGGIPSSIAPTPLTSAGVERLSLTGLEPTVFLSPERKRTAYDNTAGQVPSDVDPGASLGNFSEADLEDHNMSTSSSVAPHFPSATPRKKHINNSQRVVDHPPASVPDLPKISEDTVSHRNYQDSALYVMGCV